jgi:succinate dehydrogenase/fumarate reductase flavoprotein subunit
MSPSSGKEESIQADVLCIGGGIAGLMAAIRASELGAKVVVAEKGNAVFSGRGRAGNDHFWCYIPEVHGMDVDSFIKESLKGPKLRTMMSGTGMKVIRTFLQKSFDIVKLWDSWGIPMKHDGRWEFSGHSFPGDVLNHLKYRGRWQKKVLTEKALEKGVQIVNRVMITDLLGDGETVVGATGVHTRDDRMVVFRAKSIILGTGTTDRLFPPPVPGWMSSTPNCLSLTGDGRAMAHRAGATLVGPEMPKRHPGPRYFARFGQATWVGVLRDPFDRPVGPYVTKPDRRYGDMTMEARSTILDDYLKSGRGPVYMDCRGIAEDDYKYMMNAFVDEGMTSVINHLKEEGIDLRKTPVEFGTYHMCSEGKILINEKAETPVKGLYAAGDESILSIGPSSTYGWIAGESAALYAKSAPEPETETVREQIEEQKGVVAEILKRKQGLGWKEANVALQQVMIDYAGPVRSETMLAAGLSYVRRLKEKFAKGVIAQNRWELTRCMETRNLLDLGELVFLAAAERKESRGLHNRIDYALTDPMLDDKVICIRRVNGKPVLEWEKIG